MILAITKMLHIKSGGNTEAAASGRLKNAIDYIFNPEKTGERLYTGAVNCIADANLAFEKMVRTKEYFGKMDQRQGYHFIISFAPGETDAKTAFEIIGRFAEEYLGERYEAVYSVHDNTDVIHGHIVFNSVSFFDGKKYHYDNGDWQKYVQPIVNRLCSEYGLSTIKVDLKRKSNKKDYTMYESRNLSVVRKMIMRDIDAAIIFSKDIDEFMEELEKRGYEIKTGKYLAIRPPLMQRFIRLKSFGEDYTEAEIVRRISRETVENYSKVYINPAPRIYKSYYKKASGKRKKTHYTAFQRRNLALMYRLGLIKKKNYSEAFKYKKELVKFHDIQQQTQLILNHNIKNFKELISFISNQKEIAKQLQAQKRRLYRKLESIENLKKGEYDEKSVCAVKASLIAMLDDIKEKQKQNSREITIANRIAKESLKLMMEQKNINISEINGNETERKKDGNCNER